MAASDAEIAAFIAMINARANAGSDEARLALGSPGGSIINPFVSNQTISGTFDTGKGLGSDINGSLALQALVEGVADFNVSYVTPTGSVTMFAGSSAPSGWLLCNGSAVSRTTYANLFAVIGTTYGVGDGSTTFNLPNFTAKFPRGAGTPGSTGGSDTNSHTHQLPIGWDESFEYWSSVGGFDDNPKFGSVAIGSERRASVVKGIESDGASRNALSDTPSSTENRPAFMEMYFIIRT